MNTASVKINVDAPERIANLYGIGFVLAERIVSYRNTKGYFHGPEELALVHGISLNLAFTLSPHIDWCLPTQAKSPRYIFHRRDKDADKWLAWINVRLPDTDQQKALKRALDKVYPRTLFRFIPFLLGGILVETVKVVYDWIVQQLLNRLPPFFP